jgi:hypothetical protein
MFLTIFVSPVFGLDCRPQRRAHQMKSLARQIGAAAAGMTDLFPGTRGEVRVADVTHRLGRTAQDDGIFERP